MGSVLVDFLARSVDIRTLLIKGPSAEKALGYHRHSVDVDVLVEPERFVDLLDLLREHGFVGDVSLVEDSWAHAVEVVSAEWSVAVDVHRWFPGIEVAPERAFDLLWEHAVSVELAARSCTTLDRPGHALLIGLHAARSRHGSCKRDEVTAAMASLSAEEREAMRHLAKELAAEPVLGIVLEEFSAATTPGVRARWKAVADKQVARIWYHRIRGSRNLWQMGREIVRGLRRRRRRLQSQR